MADRVATQNGNWNDTATWGGAAVPTISETVHLLTFHVTANVAASCTWLTGGSSSELILTKNDFTASGTITLAEIAVTTAVDMAGVTLSASLVDIGTNGSLTLSDDLAIDGNLELGGGTLDMGSNNLTVYGNITYSGGSMANDERVIQGSGNLDWFSSVNLLDYEQAAGSLVSLVNSESSWIRKFTQPGDATLQSPTGKYMVMYQADAGWWNALGTVTADVHVNRTSSAPGSTISLVNADLYFQTSSVNSITMDAGIALGTGALRVYGSLASANSYTLTMGSYGVTCGDVVIGRATAVTGKGTVDLGSGTHSIASIAGGHANNDGNTLALGTCTIRNMTTGIVGLKIDTVTATVAHLYGDGTSTITDVTLASGTIICHNFNQAGSTGNSGDIIFVGAVPGAIVPSGILQHTRHQNRRRSRRMA